MTIRDLHAEYKSKVGRYPSYKDFEDTEYSIIEYIDWLEEELIRLKDIEQRFINALDKNNERT